MDNSIILKDFKEILTQRFGNNVDKVILFGSRVSGNAKEYSDYDILIVLKNDYDWHLENEILNLGCEINLKHDILMDIKIISNPELNTLKGKQPFILNAINEGVYA